MRERAGSEYIKKYAIIRFKLVRKAYGLLQGNALLESQGETKQGPR